MLIQRPSEREQRPSAFDVFTDREELIAAFERNLVHKQSQDHRMLVFYGDGGIGKTTLLQKLEQLCQATSAFGPPPPALPAGADGALLVTRADRRGPLEALEAKAIQAVDAERLQRALRHVRVIQPPAEWAAWLVKRLEQQGKGTIWQPLLAVSERGLQDVTKELGANDPAIAGLLDQ